MFEIADRFAEINPETHRDKTQLFSNQKQLVQILMDREGGFEKAVSNSGQLTLKELTALCTRFEGRTFDNKISSISYLNSKVQEYSALKSDIDAIDESMVNLAIIKPFIKDAFNQLDFEEVEHLLSLVREAELEIAEITAILRANVALLRGRGQQAYNLLSACAYTFASVSLIAPMEKHNSFASILYKHGMLYGGDGLSHSIIMWMDAISQKIQSHHPMVWAACQTNLAIALRNQGLRTKDPEGTALLTQAVNAHREALTVRTQAQHPILWAATQNNLANALSDQGKRTNNQDGVNLLAQAISAYRQALTVYTKAKHPRQWAAMQYNLANALSDEGSRTIGQQGQDLLLQAISSYREILIVWTNTQHPAEWAMAQKGLAEVFLTMAQHDSMDDPAENLMRALEHITRALTIIELEHTPHYYKTSIALRDRIIANLAEIG